MMTPSMPHAYYSEVVQTIAGLLGVMFGIWAILDARKDQRFWLAVLIEERRLGRLSVTTESRYDIARVQSWSELATFCAQSVLLVIGISGLFLAPPDGYVRAFDRELLGIAISRYGMAFVSCLLTFKSILRRHGRITYIRTIRRDDAIRRGLQASTPSQGHH